MVASLNLACHVCIKFRFSVFLLKFFSLFVKKLLCESVDSSQEIVILPNQSIRSTCINCKHLKESAFKLKKVRSV